MAAQHRDKHRTQTLRHYQKETYVEYARDLRQ